MPLALKLLHVLVAIWLITGLVGRNLALAEAKKADDIRAVKSLMQLVGRFDNLMVIPGSMAVLVAGLLTAWAEGYPILGALQGAQSNWVLVSLILFLTIVPLVNLVFIPRGKVFESALQDAVDQNRITSQLTIAFADPVVSAARVYELAVVTVIVILMVTKPF